MCVRVCFCVYVYICIFFDISLFALIRYVLKNVGHQLTDIVLVGTRPVYGNYLLTVSWKCRPRIVVALRSLCFMGIDRRWM